MRLQDAPDLPWYDYQNVAERQVVAVQRAAYGTYIDGQVVLNEPAPARGRSDVVVVFLDEIRPQFKLSDIFSVYGTWEDSMPANELAQAIRDSRTERNDICL